MNSTDAIQALLAECEEEARRQGLKGTFEPQPGDLEWVCEQLGRKPTSEEWRVVGLRWVGDAHCGEKTTREVALEKALNEHGYDLHMSIYGIMYVEVPINSPYTVEAQTALDEIRGCIGDGWRLKFSGEGSTDQNGVTTWDVFIVPSDSMAYAVVYRDSGKVLGEGWSKREAWWDARATAEMMATPFVEDELRVIQFDPITHESLQIGANVWIVER